MNIDWVVLSLSPVEQNVIEFWKLLDKSLDFNVHDVAGLSIIHNSHYKMMMCDEPNYLFDPRNTALKFVNHPNYYTSFISMIDELAIFALLPMNIAIEKVIKRLEITHPDRVSINIGIMYMKLVRAQIKKEQVTVELLTSDWKDSSDELLAFIYHVKKLTPLNIKSHARSNYMDIYSCILMLKYKDPRYTNPPDFGYRVIFSRKNSNPIIKDIILKIFG